MGTSPQQIFEYLLAVQNLTHPPVRDFRHANEYRYVDQLPQGKGCYLFGKGKSKEAWLELHKPDAIPAPPEPDDRFKDWLKTDYHNPEIEPMCENIKTLPDNETDEHQFSSQMMAFEELPDRVRAFQHWLEEWKNWAENVKHIKAVQELYNRFFSLVNQIEREGETLELVFGHGILLWDHSQGRIMHPLLTTRVELHFDTRKGTFTLTPTQKGTTLETEMLSGVKFLREAHLPQMKKRVEEKGLNPLNPEETVALYKEIVQHLHPEGQFIQSDQQVRFKKIPIIVEKPVWFIRKRATQLWKDELNAAIEALKNGINVPKTIQSLLQYEQIQPDEQERKAWSTVGEDLYFPLPANQEQKEIALRLANHYGVTVQGPPGTGKSHTIANLISHLLAHGKKVLVTSQKEPALRVLADKIPEQIRSLCVSVLGQDSTSLQEIDQSIQSISNEMAMQDPTKLGQEVAKLKRSLLDTRKRIKQLHLQLKEMASKNMTPIQWGGETYTPLEAAQKLTETENEQDWIPDAIKTNPPLEDAELRELWRLVGELTPDTQSLLHLTFHDPDTLPNPSAYRTLLEEGEKLEKQLSEKRNLLERYHLPRSNTERQHLSDLLQPILKEIRWLQPQYSQKILDDLAAGGKRQELWTEFILSVEKLLQEIMTIHSRLAEYEIRLPDTPLHQLQQDLQVLLHRLREGKSIKGWYQLLSGRKLRYLTEFPILDGRSIQSLEDAELIFQRLTFEEKQGRLIRRWNTLMSEVEGPTIDSEENRMLARTDEMLHHLKQLITIQQHINHLKDKATSVKLPEDFQWNSPESLAELESVFDAVKTKQNHQQWELNFERQAQILIQASVRSKSHPICDTLATAWRQKDADFWKAAYEELVQLHQYRQKHLKLNELFQRLQSKAPNWADQIRSRMGTPAPFPDHWQDAWEWKRVYTEVEEINRLMPEKLEQKLEEEQQRERRLLESIVAKSAWREQLLRITEPQKRALIAWKQKIKRIGKGTGKYATKHRNDARKEMEKCQAAIPVWIMPIHRVIENLDIHNNKFDVLIVDESSQCDLFALSALLRAERAVIVGDEEQISPAGVGIDQEAVQSLINQHLQGIPQANNLDMQASLYEVATRIFPGKLMLREHFRSVPEIIQFSNQLSYNGEIIPLRLPTQETRLEPAILTRHVNGHRDEKNKINEAEVEAIVEDIQAMLSDVTSKNRTIGVISLLGSEQAQAIENRLHEVIGEKEMLNRKIICGDAYAFQGDERDIICLSMVVANNVRYQSLTRNDAKQRFNVAASRAKDQIRLYHSVRLEDLKPDDYRYRLLYYCLHPHNPVKYAESPELLCETSFERDVLQMIRAQGYHVRPQVQVGSYRIDLVVEGSKNRLAVECDGDHWNGPDRWEDDLLGQQTLERAGWIFWRIRGSAFYRNPNKTMEPLWQKLKELHIEQIQEAKTDVPVDSKDGHLPTETTIDNAIPENPVPTREFLSCLTPSEAEFLSLFVDKKEIQIQEGMAFARSKGLMMRRLIDDINEKAYNHLGDIILEEQGQQYLLTGGWEDVMSIN